VSQVCLHCKAGGGELDAAAGLGQVHGGAAAVGDDLLAGHPDVADALAGGGEDEVGQQLKSSVGATGGGSEE